MKTLFIALLATLPCICMGQVFSEDHYSQYKDFASPTDQEIKMTKCSIDPDAPAVFLRKDCAVFPDDRKMFCYYRNRIKILKKTGIDYADVKIRFRHQNEWEQINNIKAVAINFDNGIPRFKTVEPKNMYIKKEDDYHSTVSFTFPDVNEGTIIEYSYTSERKSYLLVDYWYFQDELPVLNSVFDYTIMANAEFSYRVLKSAEYPISMKQDKSVGRLIFEMNNMPGIKDEPFMDSRRDYLSRVELQMNYEGNGIDRNRFASTWPELTQQLLKDEEFGKVITGRIKGTETILGTAANISSPEDKLFYIYNQVQKQISWNRYIGIFASESLKDVWNKRSGSSAEINLTLINLLNQVGFNATPLLVSDRYHGKVNLSHPFVNQFSKVIAFVEFNNRTYYLDASQGNSNPALIPQNFLNTVGYKVDKKNSGFQTIEDKFHQHSKIINIKARIDQGVIKGEAFISDKDYSRINKEQEIRIDKNAFINNHYIKPYSNLSVDSFKVLNLDVDSLPLNQQFEFSQRLEESGEYRMIQTNLFSGLGTNPFLANQRYTEINFGTQSRTSFNESIEIPGNVVIESLPKSMTLRTADNSMVISRTAELNPNGSSLQVRIIVEINKTVFPPEEYGSVKEFFKKMYEVLNEPIVLKPKV